MLGKHKNRQTVLCKSRKMLGSFSLAMTFALVMFVFIAYMNPIAALSSGNGSENNTENMRQGHVSVINTAENNPYHGQITVNIDIGSEFATFEGSEHSEGNIVKTGFGRELVLPKVHARSGYYFVGWSQGGIPDEPVWGIDVEKVTLDSSASDDSMRTSIYALYADEDGNGYCTCGAYKEGAYVGKMDEIRNAYRDYEFPRTVFDMIFCATFALLCLGICAYYIMPKVIGARDGKDRDEKRHGNDVLDKTIDEDSGDEPEHD